MKYKNLLIANLLLIWTPLSGQELIRIAYSPSPYYSQEEYDIEGLYGTLYREAFATVGIEVQFLEFPIERGVSALFNGIVDAHSPGTLYIRGSERDQIIWEPVGRIASIYLYCDPYQPMGKVPAGAIEDRMKFFAENKISLVAMKNNPAISFYQSYGVNLILVETMDQAVRIIEAGHADYAALEMMGALITIYSLFPEKVDSFHSDEVPAYDTSLAFLKSNDKAIYFLEKFREGLEVLKSSGRYLELFEIFWGSGNVPKNVMTEDMESFGTSEIDLSQINHE